MGLSALVVFVTTYLLVLPAITLEKDAAIDQGGIDVNTAQQEQNTSESEPEDISGKSDEDVREGSDAEAKEEKNSDSRKTGELVFDGDGYSLSAMCDEDAGLPEDTRITAEEITEKAKDYESWYEKTRKALQEELGSKELPALNFVRFYDISLLSGDDSVEPSSAVDVMISYDKPMDVSDTDNLQIVHFAEDENGKLKPEVLDIEAKADEIQFEAESFSVYAIAEVTEPGELNDGSYSILYYNTGVTAAGLNNTAKNSNTLNGHQLLVRPDFLEHESVLFVDKNTQLPTYMFELQSDGTYYVSTVVNNVRKYLTITGTTVTLEETPTANSHITVEPGTDENAGRFALSNNGYYLNQKDGKASNGFNAVKGKSKSTWMNLVDRTKLSDDDFTLYTARKVNLSDEEEVPDGSQVIVYTRIWNEDTLEYEFYAVDQDGKLFRCYESGDVIQWVGSQSNTAIWNFSEVTSSSGSIRYTLQNDYSKEFIAPRLSNNGQILSSEPLRLTMNGRKYGEAYSSFLVWDDPAYDYAGVKTENGQIVQCHRVEAEDFYFAIMEPTVTPLLEDVKTVDNNDFNITMKMQNYTYQGHYLSGKYRQEDQANVLGLDSNKAGIITSNLGEDGYPVATESGRSLKDLYENYDDLHPGEDNPIRTVNHLFLQSTYDESGYLEYDCTQNFAYLGDGTDFTVYNDLGTNGTRDHGQFMPYNVLGYDPSHLYSSATNQTDVLGNPLSDLDPRKGEQLYYINATYPGNTGQVPAGGADYFFGMEMEASFMQTPSGLDAWGHDIIFEFSGDDDFWFYVDGELILDLGGVHSASVGKINFRTGEVEMIVRDGNGNTVVSRSKTTTLRDLFESNYRSRGMSEDEIREKLGKMFTQNADGQYVFTDDSVHTMKMFYMERGAGSSNLHMRFNLTAVKPGEVKLQKTVSGTDSRDYNNFKYAYQIEYFDDQEGWLQLKNTEYQTPVTLEGTDTGIEYKESVEIGGVTYDHVYFLTPTQTALINFGDDNTEYRIRECGIMTSLYDEVKANGVPIEGTPTSVERQEDYTTGGATVIDRKKVTFDNHVNQEALRSMYFTKQLYEEDGETELRDDPAAFNFVVYMGDEKDPVPVPCDMAEYHVLDSDGYYCYWSMEDQKFKSFDKKVFAELTQAEKDSATFTTSSIGEIEKIPAWYTVELHDCLVGSKFMVTESTPPKGYEFMKYDRVETIPAGETENAGTIREGTDPHVLVKNRRGWGLTIEKIWSDDSFMESHDPIYMAVYVGEELLDGSVRRIEAPGKSVYYFFENLKDGTTFADYTVREVILTGTGISVAQNGVVSGYDSITPISGGGTLTVGGKPKSGEHQDDFSYTVTYQPGTPTGPVDNIRTDTVKNTRPGIKLVKTDMGLNALAGATFILTDEEGHAAGEASYTSGNDGLITYAYLSDGTYTLKETKIPTGYQPMAEILTIEVEDNRITGITPQSADAYELVEEENMPVLKVKNRPFIFKAVKMDQDGEPLEDMQFALYRQIVTSTGVLRKDYRVISGYGYNDLISGSDGVIPKIDQMLPPGTYYLEEKAPLPSDNYAERGDVCFTISNTGEVSLVSSISGDTIKSSTASDGTITYTLKVTNNIRKRRVSIWKTDEGYTAISTGASFALYKAEDYNDNTESVNDGARPVKTGTTNDKGILDLGNLAIGEYRLVETDPPAGYMPLDGAVRISVGAELVRAFQSGNSSYTCVSGEPYYVSGQPGGTVQIRVWNNPGFELPASGGPGTTWFYLIGGTLLIVCGIVLAARRRTLNSRAYHTQKIS